MGELNPSCSDVAAPLFDIWLALHCDCGLPSLLLRKDLHNPDDLQSADSRRWEFKADVRLWSTEERERSEIRLSRRVVLTAARRRIFLRTCVCVCVTALTAPPSVCLDKKISGAINTQVPAA